MNFRRIYAMLLRYTYLHLRSYDRLSDSFYWITLDLIIWGVTGAFFQTVATDTQNIIFMLISGVVLWNTVYRTQADINLSILEELWNKNMVNLFVSPLKFREFVASLTLLGILKALLTLSFGSLVAWIIFKVNVFSFSFHLPVFFFLLAMTGMWLGFFVSSIILRFGTRIQTLAWTFVWILSPFSAIYYPLETLPQWAQNISHFLPTSYIFEEARSLLTTGMVDYSQLGISLLLNIVLLSIGFIFLRSSFQKVLQKGLVKVY